MPAAPLLSDMLNDLLDRARVWVPDAKRYLVSPSRPAADCSLLAVWSSGVRTTGVVKPSCQAITVVTLHVTLFSCTPSGARVSADAITAATELFVDQGMAMWRGVVNGWHDGALFDDERFGCSEIDLTAGMAAIDASGGYAGWDIALSVTMP